VSEKLYRATSRRGVAGFVSKNGIVLRSAPILRRYALTGVTVIRAKASLERAGWRVKEVKNQ
jgi:hypothetical protein